jgi:head-tail adaptor
MQRHRIDTRWTLGLALGALACAVLCACQKADRASHEPPAAPAAAAMQAAGSGPSSVTAVVTPHGNRAETSRRIIRTAELSVETDAPGVATSRLAALADAHAGFVVSSETGRSTEADGAETVSTTVILRVPVESFEDVLAAVRALGSRVSNEKVTGQDVTEEYVDLEARIRAQQALEEQYMAILREAKSIPDVLAVQQKLGEVRTEIERAEGRRRLLESEASFSTITVHVARRIAGVEAGGPGFGRSVHEAWSDAITVGLAIVNGAIRLVGFLLPVSVLVVLPAALLLRTWRRRKLGRV